MTPALPSSEPYGDAHPRGGGEHSTVARMGPLMRTRTVVLIALVSFIALFVRAASIVPDDWSGEWELETTMLAARSVYEKKHHGMLAPMGYPFTLDAKRPVWKSDVFDPYLRQFGLIPMVESVIAPASDDGMNRFLLASRFAFAALACAAAGVLIALIGRSAGPAAATGALLVLLGSHQFADFARSAYWGLFLPVLVVGWSWYIVDRSRGNRIGLAGLAGLGLLVFLECLTGYEYVSALLMMPFAAIGYVAVTRGLSVRAAARPVIEMGIAGFLGFVAAFSVHLATLWATMGRDVALDNTIANAWRRSVGQPTPLRAQLFGIYGVFAHDKYLAGLLFVWTLCLVTVAVRRRFATRNLIGLAAASVIAVAAASSWLVLARKHVALAPGVNMIPFYYGATILAGAFLAELIATEVRRRKSQPA